MGIDIVTLALAKKYADSKGGGSRPTKLSDFENDLYYAKKESFLTLHKEDFIPRYKLDDDGNPTDEIEDYYYKGTPKLDWLKNVNSFDFELTVVDPEIGEAVVINKADTGPWYFEGPFDFGESFIHSNNFPLKIANGFNYIGDAPEDAYYIWMYLSPSILDMITSFVIYKVDAKQIPQECVGGMEECVSGIEEAFYELDELWNYTSGLPERLDEVHALASQPNQVIATAVANGSRQYNVTIEGLTLQPGTMITLLPNSTLTGSSIKLSVNGGTAYSVRMSSLINVANSASGTYNTNNSDTTGMNTVYLYKDQPVVLVFTGSEWRTVNVGYLTEAAMVGLKAWPQTISCSTAADEQVKTSDYVWLFPGKMLLVRFQNGNTAEYPKLKFGMTEESIIDNGGNPVQTLDVPAGGQCVFMYTSHGYLRLF